MRMCGRRAAGLLAAALVSAPLACGRDDQRYLTNGMDPIIVGGDKGQPASASGGLPTPTPEEDFRALMDYYHVPKKKVDCMVSEAFDPSRPVTTTPPPMHARMFSREELNAMAATCGVDTSRLWYVLGD